MGLFGFKKKENPEQTPEKQNVITPASELPQYITVVSWDCRDAIVENSVKLKNFDLSDDELIDKKPKQRIYQRCFPRGTKAEVIPEPNNPHDKNALMVMIGGQKVGYIPREDQPIAIAVMKNKRQYFKPYLTGGNYKYVDGNYVEYNHDDFGIRLYIEVEN